MHPCIFFLFLSAAFGSHEQSQCSGDTCRVVGSGLLQVRQRILGIEATMTEDAEDNITLEKLLGTPGDDEDEPPKTDDAYPAETPLEVAGDDDDAGHGVARHFTGDGRYSLIDAVENATTPSPNVPLPGIFFGAKTKLILGQDIDYPPYAYLGVPPESDYDTAGIGHDIAHGLAEVCDLEVFTVQTHWEDCWNAGHIGEGLSRGEFHGCMTYTHTAGERNRFLEFSNPIMQMNKPAGLLTRLVNGVPVVNGLSLLSGVTVVDVVGWAPTADTLALVENKCLPGTRFTNFTMLTPTVPDGKNANDLALEMLLDGTADAVWIYADQAYNYDCTDVTNTPAWNCTLWSGFGTTFAFVQTGLLGYAIAGTTLTMSKKGSGVKDIVDPCIAKFLETEAYYNICEKHHSAETCFPNSFFPAGSDTKKTAEIPTNELNTTCADGYCPCPLS